MKHFSRYIFPSIVALSAISVSASAAFYSVTGLSKLFAGASLEVLIMASTLEFSKLVIASLLHWYWSDLNKFLRYYLLLAVVVLVFITSMGIYGFLSAAYQQTANQAGIVDNKIEFLQQKEKFYQEDIDRYDLELRRISETIQTLSQARTTQIQIRDTSVAGGVRTSVSTAEVNLARQRIQAEEANRQEILSSRSIASDSLQSIKIELLEVQSNNELAAELGPLKYLSGLTGASMDRIVNVLLLTIIFVFDPLAISLVIAANFGFKRIKDLPKEIDSDTPKESVSIFKKTWDDLADEIKSVSKKSKVTENSDNDWKVVDDEVFEEEDNKEDTLIEDAPRIKEERYKKIIHKSPKTYKVETEAGEIKEIHKDQINKDENKIRYL